MRNVHEWTKSKASTVTNTHGLRKNYEWQEDPPKRSKSTTSISPKKTKKDNHHKRLCPMDHCRFVGIKVGRHLVNVHGMTAGHDNYRDALKAATRYTPITKEMINQKRSMMAEQNRREELVAQQESMQHNQMEHTDSGDNGEEEISESQVQAKEVEDSIALFHKYLTTHEGGKREAKSSLQAVQEVRRAISCLQGNILNFFNPAKLRDDFLIGNLEKRCTPGTCKHYLQSMISFFEFQICEPTAKDVLQFPPSKEECIAMKLRLSKWMKSYNKSIDERKWEIEEEENEALITPDQVKAFEEGELAREVVKLFGKVVEDNNFVPSITEFTKMRNYLIVCVALSCAARSGVSASMTLTEFGKHVYRPEDNMYQIYVRRHKTFRSFGFALVCLTVQHFNYLKLYVDRVRPTFPVESERIFLSWKGKEMCSGAVSENINRIWRQAGVYGDREPPKKKMGATVIRRSVTTLIHKNDPENAQVVADLLAHSVTTARKTYRRKQMQERAVLATNAISRVLRPSSTITKAQVNKSTER